MQTIEFVLRSRAGSFQEGSLTGESGNTTIFLQTGDQVSLHLARYQVAGYEREGSNLIVKLADGREIVLSDYFSGDTGDQPRAYPIAGPTHDDHTKWSFGSRWST